MPRHVLFGTISWLLLATVVVKAAPPLAGSGVSPLHEGPSEGLAISGPAISRPIHTDGLLNVCVIRAQFLEDYTPSTTGNGLFDLDADPPHDRTYFENLTAQMNGYFTDVSGGELELFLEIFPLGLEEVYDMPHQMPWYGSDEKSMTGACELLRDAVEASDDDIDFSQYDAVIVFHAGAGQESDVYRNSTDDLHSVFLRLIDLQYYLPEGSSSYEGIPTNDGVFVREGMIVPETESQDGYGFGVIGTVCHEFFHQLGLPDLYNTYDGTVGVGAWDIMGYGQWVMSGWWPAMPGAWSKMFLEWIPVRDVEGTGTFTVSVSDTILRVPLSGTEYLLIENRQRDPDGDGMCGTDEHDWGLPGSGILIWHIDETRLGSNVANNTVNVDPLHKGVDLEEADGIQDFDWSLPDVYGIEGSEYDPWFAGGICWIFGPGTEPSTVTSWGGNTWVTVEVLDERQNSMEVTVGRSGVVPGWPISTEPLSYGPLLWDDSDGERIVLTTETGFTRCWDADGSNMVPMGIGVTAPPVAGNPGSGPELLLVCENDGEVHLRAIDWSEPAGWPVTLPDAAVHCMVSSHLSLVAAATEGNSLYLIDAGGHVMDGWPASVSAPIRGICVYPDPEHPGIAVSTADGSLHLFDTNGRSRPNWPVHPGDEQVGFPVSADIDRDGEVEIILASGDAIYSYGPEGELEPGFPAVLQGEPLSSVNLASLDQSGTLSLLMEIEEGIVAVGASGATTTDWPYITPTDSLGFEYNSLTRGIGGSRFAAAGLRDGRICLFDENGNQTDIFPVSVGDAPIGSPVLWKFNESGQWQLIAADAGGYVGSWFTSFEPDGWFTGLDRGGENCWWTEDLPAAVSSAGMLVPGSFFVYPNPVRTGEGSIRFQPGSDCSWVIRVFNIAGDLVTVSRGSAPGGAPWEVLWETSDLSPGVYFVNLELSSAQGSESALFQAAVVH